MWLPLNDISVNFYYDQRIIISVQEMDKPITWKVSKVENIHPIGINKITLSQTKFNPETDRKVNGYWYADYGISGIEPKGEPFIESHEGAYSKIAFSGKNPVIKVGGGEKKFTAAFYDENGISIQGIPHWSYSIEKRSVSDGIILREEGVSVYIKVTDESLIGKILTLQVEDENGDRSSEIKADIAAL